MEVHLGRAGGMVFLGGVGCSSQQQKAGQVKLLSQAGSRQRQAPISQRSSKKSTGVKKNVSHREGGA